ncbi:MAG: GTP 3',8-cyclase MoaA [Microbacteriaceae bacterium]
MTIALGMPVVRAARAAAGRPDAAGLVDSLGRVARDLRVSLTERCSLRCRYCMPAEGLPRIAAEALLTAEEVARLVGIAVAELGIREVRFTGGEPLMRPDLERVVALSRAAAPGARLSMTTNAVGLERRAAGLAAAGLDRVNVSLDTVDRERFARLTRRDRLPAVLAGIRAAGDAGLDPVKVNAVLVRDTLPDAAALVAWALESGCELRFIEQMPLDADRAWARESMVSAGELVAALAPRFRLGRPHRDDPHAPAEHWEVRSASTGALLGTVGIIASVTRSFCESCDRSRLTAEGSVRPCLFGDEETDLRALLRGGASDAELAERWREAQWAKQPGHGIQRPGFVPPVRSMGAIGG